MVASSKSRAAIISSSPSFSASLWPLSSLCRSIVDGRAAFCSTAISMCSRCRSTGIAHDAIRSGNIGWNHLTDLGVNFIGSYSFYLLGSPFFWLTIPFPGEWLQYLMGPLFILKFGCASLSGYIYLHRYAKNPNTALLASLLYAFSGYSIYNIFFNHFHEAIIVFPLLLAALDEYMYTKRRGILRSWSPPRAS